MTAVEETPRVLAATAVSLTLHAALLALLATQGAVELALSPSPILLTLLEAGDRTAGPGERSPLLQSARPATAKSPMPAKTPTPPASPDVSAPKAAPVPPSASTTAPPPPVAKPAAIEAAASKSIAKKPVAPPSRAKNHDAAGEAASALPQGSSASAASSLGPEVASIPSGTGTDARSTAPAWAPTARVRYEELLFSWMDRHKEYPLLAQRRGLEGSGLLRVRIDRDGRVVDRRIDRSTGETTLDRAALDMVRRASPFPKVPAEYAGSSFEFVAPIEYRLR